MRVLLSGGGTGGHLVPGLELARRLLARGDRVHLARPGRAVEAGFLHGLAGLEVHELPVRGGRLRLPFAISRRLRPAGRLLDRAGIDIVVGLGGRGSLPCVGAAWLRRLPFVLLEQNQKLGKANRLLARFARRVYVTYPETLARLPARSGVLTGMPLRRGLGGTKDAALVARYRLADRLVVLVLGGSQGADVFNRELPALLAGRAAGASQRLAVIHIAGVGKESIAAAAWARTGVEAHVLAFEPDMAPLYSVADLVIARGGGTTLAEVAAAGRAAVVVPYPWHRDQHQLGNARWLEARGACRVLEQRVLEAGDPDGVIAGLLGDAELRRRVADAGRAAMPTDGGTRIAHDLGALVAASRGQERAG